MAAAIAGISNNTTTKAQLNAVIARIEALEKAFKAMDAHIKSWDNPGIWAKLKGNSAALTASRKAAKDLFAQLRNIHGAVLGSKAYLQSIAALF